MPLCFPAYAHYVVCCSTIRLITYLVITCYYKESSCFVPFGFACIPHVLWIFSALSDEGHPPQPPWTRTVMGEETKISDLENGECIAIQ